MAVEICNNRVMVKDVKVVVETCSSTVLKVVGTCNNKKVVEILKVVGGICNSMVVEEMVEEEVVTYSNMVVVVTF